VTIGNDNSPRRPAPARGPSSDINSRHRLCSSTPGIIAKPRRSSSSTVILTSLIRQSRSSESKINDALHRGRPHRIPRDVRLRQNRHDDLHPHCDGGYGGDRDENCRNPTLPNLRTSVRSKLLLRYLPKPRKQAAKIATEAAMKQRMRIATTELSISCLG
jgi:hypothetical protein